MTKCIFCYETNEKFERVKDAAEKYNLLLSAISHARDKPHKTAGGYHWCTSLDTFAGIVLSGHKDWIRQEVYCYETRIKYNSIDEATRQMGLVGNNHIRQSLNKPNRTAGGYHWCTSLGIFDNITLNSSYSNIERMIYCYETNEKFKSISDAARAYNTSDSAIGRAINKSTSTICGYHWCTDLSVFDGVELIYPDSGVSGLEKELVDYIKSIYQGELIENSRDIISPYELDIYLPDLKLAFEFNGNYWHSEAGGKDRNYHINKTKLCKSQCIQLIHIYEHQWKSSKDKWRMFIINKLKMNPVRIYARTCIIKKIDNITCSKFLEINHLQGSCNASVKLGLYYNDNLVSVMTFGKPRFNKNYEYELIRFASLSCTNVIGGASKLLKYFELNYKPKSIISYANLQWSTGDVYTKLGFDYIGNSEPSYVWNKSETILQRYQTMKHKLDKLLGDKFNSSLTETENMENNGYSKLWDCGNMIFIKEYKV